MQKGQVLFMIDISLPKNKFKMTHYGAFRLPDFSDFSNYFCRI